MGVWNADLAISRCNPTEIQSTESSPVDVSLTGEAFKPQRVIPTRCTMSKSVLMSTPYRLDHLEGEWRETLSPGVKRFVVPVIFGRLGETAPPACRLKAAALRRDAAWRVFTLRLHPASVVVTSRTRRLSFPFLQQQFQCVVYQEQERSGLREVPRIRACNGQGAVLCSREFAAVLLVRCFGYVLYEYRNCIQVLRTVSADFKMSKMQKDIIVSASYH